MINFFNKLTLWQKDLLVLLILNAAILTHIVGLSDVAGIVFLAIFPGIVIQRLIAYKAEFVWERIVHTVALSVSFVMFAGLIVNTLLPLLNIVRPLEQLPVLVSFNVLLIALIVTNFILKKEVKIFLKDFSIKDAISRMLPHLPFFILPILAIAGATILNNGGANIVTGITICIVAALSLYAVSFDHSKRESLIITGLYCASLTLLLISSMRSSHVIGWDINAELQVFRLTQDAAYWSMSHLQDAYNACLSITLLPTIFSNFIHISDEYMYKFLFQFFFALMPISVFYFVRNFFGVRIAILSVIMLIGQVVFSHGMPALIRQEFGFLYFSLMLLILFSAGLEVRKRYILAIIYGSSIIVSHYSTTYIAVFLFTSMIFLNLIVPTIKKVFPNVFPGQISRTISIWYIVFLIMGTFVWGAIITNTSNNLTRFLDYSGSNIERSFTYDTWSNAIKQIFTPYPHYQDLSQYKQQETVIFRRSYPDMTFYEESLTNLDAITSITFAKSPGLFGVNGKMIAGRIFELLKLVLNNLFIVLGIIILVCRWYVRKYNSSEFIFLAISGFIMFLLLLLLPDALGQYNIDRLYFQLLMIWASLSCVAGFFLLSFMPVNMRFMTLGVLYCTLMLFYSSLVFTITGGSVLSSMSNFGQDYEKFYAHESEVYAARWLGDRSGTTPIFASSSGYLRLRGYSNVDQHQIFLTTLPSVIDKNSYVFLTHMNIISGISTYEFYNEEYAYTAPMNFFNKNKNLIYDSGTSRVYR